MRATTHFARTTRKGKAFSTKHNDRNYDPELKPDNIIPEKTKDNVYKVFRMENEPEDVKTFEEHEKWIYENYLGSFFKSINDKYEKQRHSERCKTIDEFRKMPRYCPEEVLWYVGKKDNSAAAEDLEKIVQKQIQWEEQKYPGLQYLDYAVHVDEMGAPHVQARRIWTYQKDGVTAVGQNKALESMGVALPNPSAKIDQLNNRKITYTEESRKHYIELAKSFGYEIEETPRSKEQSGLTLDEWQKEQEQAKTFLELKNQLDTQEKKQITQTRANEELKKTLDERSSELDAKETQLNLKQASYDAIERIAEETVKKYRDYPNFPNLENLQNQDIENFPAEDGFGLSDFMNDKAIKKSIPPDNKGIWSERQEDYAFRVVAKVTNFFKKKYDALVKAYNNIKDSCKALVQALKNKDKELQETKQEVNRWRQLSPNELRKMANNYDSLKAINCNDFYLKLDEKKKEQAKQQQIQKMPKRDNSGYDYNDYSR